MKNDKAEFSKIVESISERTGTLTGTMTVAGKRVGRFCRAIKQAWVDSADQAKANPQQSLDDSAS